MTNSHRARSAGLLSGYQPRLREGAERLERAAAHGTLSSLVERAAHGCRPTTWKETIGADIGSKISGTLSFVAHDREFGVASPRYHRDEA